MEVRDRVPEFAPAPMDSRPDMPPKARRATAAQGKMANPRVCSLSSVSVNGAVTK
jgi:hypothetical protein